MQSTLKVLLLTVLVACATAFSPMKAPVANVVAEHQEAMNRAPFVAAAAFASTALAPMVAVADEGGIDQAALIPGTLAFLALVVTMTVTFTISIWLGFGAKK